MERRFFYYNAYLEYCGLKHLLLSSWWLSSSLFCHYFNPLKCFQRCAAEAGRLLVFSSTLPRAASYKAVQLCGLRHDFLTQNQWRVFTLQWHWVDACLFCIYCSSRRCGQILFSVKPYFFKSMLQDCEKNQLTNQCDARWLSQSTKQENYGALKWRATLLYSTVFFSITLTHCL